MPPQIVLLAIAAIVAVALAHSYRTLTALQVLRALPAGGAEASRSTVQWEPIALSGELVVEDPAAMGAATVDETDRAVGAYLWRARFPDNTNSNLTIEEWGWERQRWHTFASGLEWGRFGVVTDGQTVRIDPTWLRTTTGGDSLDQVEVGATVTEFSIETRSGTSSDPGVEFEPIIEFEYAYDGTEYTGTKLYPSDIKRNYETRSAAESAVAEYDPGVRTTAYVDPDAPSDAFLKNETSSAPLIALGIGGLFTLFAAVSAVRKL